MTLEVGSRARWSRRTTAPRYPWLVALRDLRCIWCDRELASCCCLDRPGPPARPLPPLALPWVERTRAALRARDAGYRRTYRAKLRKRGVCARCQRPSERYLCAGCRAENEQYGAAWRAQCVETGRCQRCPDPVVPGKTMCRKCLAAMAERARAWRAAKRAAA